MPCDYRRYHPDWEWIRRQIKDQAGNVCEFCGVPNHTWIQRNVAGEWKIEDDLACWNSDAAWYWIGSYDIEPVWVVLTVAHLADRDPMNIDPSNLAALCQRCHLNHDREDNQRKASETQKRKRQEAIAATGQLVML